MIIKLNKNVLSLIFIVLLPFAQLKSRKLPIVYHPNYNMGFLGLENLHSFDSKKYGKITDKLTQYFKIEEEDLFYQPKNMATDKELLEFHTPEYLASLKKSRVVAQITELFPVALIPNFLVRRSLINPMKYQTAGTCLATDLALKNKDYAINLGGGFHHANKDYGHGFCPFGDIQLGMLNVWKKKPNAKIMYIDLDAHQGDGVELGLEKQIKNTNPADPRLVVFDIYGKNNFPGDNKARQYIQYNRPVNFRIRDKEYLNKVSALKKIIKKESPDIIFYNAGSDVYQKDPLGGLSISEKGVIKRDEMVFKYAQENKVPIVMTLSGGYTKESADIVSKSIINILEKTKNTTPNPNLPPLKKKKQYKKYIGRALAITAVAVGSYYVYKKYFKKNN